MLDAIGDANAIEDVAYNLSRHFIGDDPDGYRVTGTVSSPVIAWRDRLRPAKHLKITGAQDHLEVALDTAVGGIDA